MVYFSNFTQLKFLQWPAYSEYARSYPPRVPLHFVVSRNQHSFSVQPNATNTYATTDNIVQNANN